jgi:phage-related protein
VRCIHEWICEYIAHPVCGRPICQSRQLDCPTSAIDSLALNERHFPELYRSTAADRMPTNIVSFTNPRNDGINTYTKDTSNMKKKAQRKKIVWIGSALADICDFPAVSRKECGDELALVQAGEMPTDWKPFEDVGPGTKEIRVRDKGGIYRVMYVAKFEEAIYILHCFQKKTQATSLPDKNLAIIRYKLMLKERPAVIAATIEKELK